MHAWNGAQGAHRVTQAPMTAEEKLRVAGFEDAFSGMMFLHIPKTGGSSVDVLLPPERSLYKRVSAEPTKWHPPVPSPWHLAPDAFERKYHRPDSPLPRFCVVRNPTSRWNSCIRWEYARKHFRMPPEALARVYNSTPRPKIRWTEEKVHRQPQRWYVWDGDGAVQCQCVVAFERMMPLLNGTIVLLGRKSGNWTQRRVWANQTEPLPEPLEALYAKDRQLWERALHSKSVCYRPAAGECDESSSAPCGEDRSEREWRARTGRARGDADEGRPP